MIYLNRLRHAFLTTEVVSTLPSCVQQHTKLGVRHHQQWYNGIIYYVIGYYLVMRPGKGFDNGFVSINLNNRRYIIGLINIILRIHVGIRKQIQISSTYVYKRKWSQEPQRMNYLTLVDLDTISKYLNSVLLLDMFRSTLITTSHNLTWMSRDFIDDISQHRFW